MKRNLIILIALFAVIAAVIWQSRKEDNAAELKSGTGTPSSPAAAAVDPAAPKKGSPAPAFKLPALEGNETYAVGGKRDKVLIVNFWASWCGPCQLEAPDLTALYDKYKDRVDLYAVNATPFDRLKDAKDFAKEQGFVFPVLTDEKGDAGDDYKVFSYPTSFIIDRNGVIRERIEGVIQKEQWEKYLDDAVAS